MKKINVLTLTLTLLLFSSALAADQLPGEMNSLVPLYPGAKVLMSQTTPAGMVATLEIADQPGQAKEFYKKEMTAKGWAIKTEVQADGLFTVIYEKDAMTLVVDPGLDQNGKSCVLLSLSK